MEKRNSKRHESVKKSSKIADQGDNVRDIDKNNEVKQTNTRTLLQADRGDSKLKQASEQGVKDNSGQRNEIKSKSYKDLIFQSKRGRLELKPSKPKNKQNNVIQDDEKAKETSAGDNFIVMDTQIKPFLNSKENFNTDTCHDSKIHVGIEKAKVLDSNERKKIREKYTIRNIHNNNSNFLYNKTSNLLQNDSSKRLCNDNQQVKKMAESKSESAKLVKETAGNKPINSNRKPVITTTRSKRDNTKVYKTVTFTDFKAGQRQPIQIKIPTDEVEKKDINETSLAKKEMCDKGTDASRHSSCKEKSINRKRRAAPKTRRAHVPSPEPVMKGESPPTEVAKWAPNTVNKQNKPYYEAWVNTTLAAITKYSKKDRMFQEKHNLLESFRRMLARPETPDLVFNNADEKYVGKIKIRQK